MMLASQNPGVADLQKERPVCLRHVYILQPQVTVAITEEEYRLGTELVREQQLGEKGFCFRCDLEGLQTDISLHVAILEDDARKRSYIEKINSACLSQIRFEELSPFDIESLKSVA